MKYTITAVLVALPVFVWSYNEPFWSWGAALTVLVLAPICEELLFRGVLQEMMSRWLVSIQRSQLWAVLAVSLLFALLHLTIRRDPFLLLTFFPSLVLGWHYLNRRSLPAVMALHSFYNLTYFL